MDIRAHTFPCRMSVLSTLPPGGLECLFPHSGYPTVSSTRYHFCFNFCQSDRWQIKRHVASVCISLVSGEAKHLFLHLWAVWFLPAKNRHCPVLGKALLGISSPPPSPSRSTGSVPPPAPRFPDSQCISSKALLPTRLVSQEGRGFALRFQQPARGGISRDPVPWLPSAPLPSPHSCPRPCPYTTETLETRSA